MTSKYHFIGIGGIGMSGLARILLERGVCISGSDLKENFLTKSLVDKGAIINYCHRKDNVTQDMSVVYSSEIPENNPELMRAKELNCNLMHRSDLLVELAKDKKMLAVTGTHGKTTTASLLASVLFASKMHPSFAIGGVLKERLTNSEFNEGQYFVAEADESDGTFEKFTAFGSIITNIGKDHIDHFGSMESLINAFKRFSSNVQSKEHLFWCGDNFFLKDILKEGISYGFCEDCHLRASNYRQDGFSSFIDINYLGDVYKSVEIGLAGSHNALNALSIFGMALMLGLSEECIRSALSSFQGVKRRCERLTVQEDIIVIDDYAHHPTEISQTLHATRQATEGKRLIAVYQPHRINRIKQCLGSFGGIFDAADEVIITDVCDPALSECNSKLPFDIIEEHEQFSSHIPITYVPKDELLSSLRERLSNQAAFIFLGAGDLTNVAKAFVHEIEDLVTT